MSVLGALFICLLGCVAGGCAPLTPPFDAGKAEVQLPLSAIVQPAVWESGAVTAASRQGMQGYYAPQPEQLLENLARQRGTFAVVSTSPVPKDRPRPVYVRARVKAMRAEWDMGDSLVGAFTFTGWVGYQYRFYTDISVDVEVSASSGEIVYKASHASGQVTHKSNLYQTMEATKVFVTHEFSKAFKQCLQKIEADSETLLASLDQSGGPAPPVYRPPARKPVGPVAQRWAVVIGISEYAHKNKNLTNLKYAHRDAEKLSEFLKSKAGGSFPASNVKLLTNRQATTKGIRDGLFTFLKRTVKEDLVVIFFSGHGTPDPDKPSNLYLVAHDSDPNNISATGIPMWDIETALKRTIAAERTIVLADTCHSAGVTEGVKGVKIGEQFNKYFAALARARPGRVIFTSCEGYEVSRESKKWGGGHGVFTWALLEALKGKADKDKSGIVTLGEVLDYVDMTVRRETANEQHPTKTGVQFDRNLPMGVVK
jgi:hypothetical protein